MNSIVLPAGWERHAAPGATLLDPLGPPLLFWIGAALMLLLAVVLSESRPALAIVLALLSTLALAIAGNGLVDDAYIQFRYAANLTEGHGPVFNPGERIEGASGGIWIGAIALASLLTGQDAVRCGRILSLGAALFATLAAAAFGAATGNRRRAALLAILWAALPTATLYAATGLETSAFGCALWVVGLAVARDRAGLAAVAAALTSMLRPEGMVLAISAAPLWRRLGRAGRAALTGALFGAIVIAAARLAYFEFPVPRSALVKGVTAAAGLDSGLRYLGRVAFEWWPLLPALPFIALHARRLAPILLPATLWTCLVIARGGDWMPCGRYLLPALVVLAAGAVSLPGLRAARLLVLGSLAWSLVLLLPRVQPFERQAFVGWAWNAMAEHRAQSRWWEALGTRLRESATPDTFLASGPSGALPYASRLRTFDLYGLCTPVSGIGGTEAGHRLWGLREAVSAGATLIYPGRDLLLVRSPDTVLPAAVSSVPDEADPLRDYRQVTILHSPEYRLDFLRDAIWVRKDRGPIPEAAGSSQGFGGLAARTSRRSAP